MQAWRYKKTLVRILHHYVVEHQRDWDFFSCCSHTPRTPRPIIWPARKPPVLVLSRHTSDPTTFYRASALPNDAKRAVSLSILIWRLIHRIADGGAQHTSSHRATQIQRLSWPLRSCPSHLQTWTICLHWLLTASRNSQWQTGDWFVLKTVIAEIGSILLPRSHCRNRDYPWERDTWHNIVWLCVNHIERRGRNVQH